MLWLLACSSPSTPRLGHVDLEGPLVVAATAADDYSAGGLAAVSLDRSGVVDVASLHGDAVVSVVDGVVYAIHRLGSGAVRRYDTLDAPPTWEIGTTTTSNPQALVGDGERLILSMLAESRLLVLDAADGGVVGQVDLSAWADADGVPEAASAAFDGNHVFVAIQRLDRGAAFAAHPTGYVLAIERVGWTVVFDVPVGPNPLIEAHPDGGVLVVTEDGRWWRIGTDGALQGPVPLGPEVVGSFGITDDGQVVAVTRDCPTCAEHRVVCRDTWDGDEVGRTDPWPVFFSDVLVDAETIWLAARRSWEDPEGVAGGYVSMPLRGCGPIPEPSDWVRGTFAPFDLAIRR